MTKKLKRPLALLFSAAVFLALLMFAPAEITEGTGFGIRASAAATITPSQPSGEGSAESPYQIGTAAELYWFAQQVNSGKTSINAVLTDNITVNTGVLKADGSLTSLEGFTSWTSIGNKSNQYTGTFDGNDHTISGLFFYNESTDYVGLFGYIGSGGRVSNVGVVDSAFWGSDYVGGISGCNYGTIESCYNAGYVNASNSQPCVGGVCGKNYGTIKNCYNIGKAFLNGVCGYNYRGTLENCYNAGTLMGTDTCGVCGYTNWLTITNCYYLNTTASDYYAKGKTAEEFANGKVAYLLQGEQETAVWGQNIDNNETKQAYPVLGGAKVYQCVGCTGKYSNTENATAEHTAPDTYDNGFGGCKDCGVEMIQPAELVDGVYQIGNAGQLYWFAEQVNSGNNYIDAVLTKDIIVNENVLVDGGLNTSASTSFRSWTPIGNLTYNYCGTFDGQSHTVSGLYFNDSTADYVGLFGYNFGTVKNVGVADSYFNGKDYVGGVCGCSDNTITNCFNKGTVSGSNYVGGVCGSSIITIENCYNAGKVTATGYSANVGGVCGCNNEGTIKDSYNEGSVEGTESQACVGGVCGLNSGAIENCYNEGSVKGIGNNAKVGGVCGCNFRAITNCYNTGEVTATGDTAFVGGVCGFNNYNFDVPTITNCYNTGSVEGTGSGAEVGGVCGRNRNGTITNCYYLGTEETDSFDGTTFKTTTQFNSGEVAYLLQSGQTADENGIIPEVWGQTLTGEGKQAYPVLGGDPVYKCTKGCTAKYSNEQNAKGEHTAPDSYDSNGFGKCTDCGAEVYQPATLNGSTYEIGNAGQLYWFAGLVNDDASVCDYDYETNPEGTQQDKAANAILTADIVVNENLLSSLQFDFNGEVTNGDDFRSWTPISNYDNYTGTFDGQGHTISGLYFNNENSEYVGLFGLNRGTIKNVGVVDSFFNGNSNIGGVCGENYGGTIENCYNTGTVSGSRDVGGVCGANNGEIENCYNKGTVSGSNSIGGVCGHNFNAGTIENCYNTGSVSGEAAIGGVCGQNYNGGTITNCYNNGEVNGKNYVGGVCGENIGTIENCYNTGSVSGEAAIGGVCGQNKGEIEICYNTGSVSGNDAIGGVCGVNSGTIRNCYNKGAVTGGDTSDIIGGVCGSNGSTIANCYNTGSVSGKYGVGGVCGQNYNGGTIANCYNTGSVSGKNGVGGVCGQNYNGGTITNCYYLDGTTIDSIATSKTTKQFASGEVAYLLQSGQTAVNGTIPIVWGQDLSVENSYPVLDGTKTVYLTTPCPTGYSNQENTTKPHTYNENGFCSDCGGYEPATDSDEDGYYEIENAGQLYWYAQQVNNGYVINAVLTADITVNEKVLDNIDDYLDGIKDIRSWTPIGSESRTYCNTFDGNNHTISGLYFNDENVQYVGLIGYSGGTIKNVGVVDSYFCGSYYVGGVCGYNFGGKITNCYNKGTVSVTGYYLGGVCGYNFGGEITNCYNIGAVSGSDLVGGVCGYNDSGTITNCYYLSDNETDSIDGTTHKTLDDFNNGEVAYLLSQGCTIDGTTYDGSVWGQDLSTTTNYPVPGGKKVYLTTPCPGYSNTETKEHTDTDNDRVCDVCGEKIAYIVSLGSQTADGEAFSVAKLDGGGKINVGESTPIVAPAVPGYTFNGWYEGETKLSADLSFVYTPTADVTLTAKYTANEKMTVTINGGENFTVSVNGVETAYDSENPSQFAVGTKLTVTATGSDFAYWENEAGSVLSRSAAYTFTVVNSATVTAVYNTKETGEVIVNFISGYDQIIDRYQIGADGAFTVPSAPTKTGCDFAGWSINDGTAITENVADAVKTAITNALATETTADDIINVKAKYNTKTETITVTVVNGAGAGTYTINAVVTVKANEPESGFKFSHWTDGNGTTLSYNTSYSFYAAKDIALTAVYVADTETVTAAGTTAIVDVIKDTTNGRISFVSMSTVPEGCTIVKAGIVATSDSSKSTNLTDANADYVRGNSWNGYAYRYNWTKKNATGVTWYVRAYLVYTDKNGNTHTLYGNLVTETL